MHKPVNPPKYVIPPTLLFLLTKSGLTTGFQQSSFHPGVIVSKSEDRCHKVAIISSLHPDKPPIRPIKDFLPKNYVDLLDGNVNLGPPEVILRKNLRRWHPDKTDKSIRVKIDPDNLAKLKEQMSK